MADLLDGDAGLEGEGLILEAVRVEQDCVARFRQGAPGVGQGLFAHPGDVEAPVALLPVGADALGLLGAPPVREHVAQQLVPACGRP